MIKIEKIIRQMMANAEAIRSLVQTISDEQAQWKPDPETWSMKEVMDHVYNEERGDFRAHLKEMFHKPPLAWGELQDGWHPVESYHRGLEDFLVEREASLAWLKALESPDWDATITASFGPAGEELVLSAGDILTSWVAHDFLHLRQMNELQYAWNEKQASPYSVQYAGGW
jgi:hypothetical protein